MATHSSILAWRIPWTEEPGGLQSTGSKELDKTERLHSLTLRLFKLQPRSPSLSLAFVYSTTEVNTGFCFSWNPKCLLELFLFPEMGEKKHSSCHELQSLYFLPDQQPNSQCGFPGYNQKTWNTRIRDKYLYYSQHNNTHEVRVCATFPCLPSPTKAMCCGPGGCFTQSRFVSRLRNCNLRK